MEPAVTDLLARGVRTVVVEAVPGAGKTHLLRALAQQRSTLILAYNSQLAAAITAATRGDAALCLTFHTL